MNSHEVLITGGSRGLGRHLALHLAARGHAVHLLGRSPLETLDADVRRAIRGCLVVSPGSAASMDAALAEAAHHTPPFDVVIANAAVRPTGRLLTAYDPIELRELIEVNLAGPALLARALLPAMLASGGGRVIMIGSRAAFGRGAGEALYAASKAGLVALTHALAQEVAGRNVTVNAICPGRFESHRGDVSADSRVLLERILAVTDRLIESRVNGRVIPVVPLRHRIKDARRELLRALRLLLPRV